MGAAFCNNVINNVKKLIVGGFCQCPQIGPGAGLEKRLVLFIRLLLKDMVWLKFITLKGAYCTLSFRF